MLLPCLFLSITIYTVNFARSTYLVYMSTGVTMSLPGSYEWEQFYDQQSIHEDPAYNFSDSTIVATSNVPDTIVSPTGSSLSHDQFMSPNKSNCVPKPIRRRSRASKRTPTTLLNANTNNFRALVQQFTGCPTKSTSVRAQKGPVNLNFQLGSVQSQSDAIPTKSSLGNNSNTYDYYHQQVQIQQQQEQLHQGQVEQQCMAAIDNSSTGYSDHAYFLMCSGNMEMEDGSYMGHDIDTSLHELCRESITDQNVNDGYF